MAKCNKLTAKNIIIAILLLFFGILPGVIYIIVVLTKKEKPAVETTQVSSTPKEPSEVK
ncbi:MAG: hypothetical protein LBH55_00395 [Mycoplasmataceae bacterium]|jgi:flagellar basal body-associated protein FliL|nr:hypothetical protein [Mycoplasmataceae bacterium]